MTSVTRLECFPASSCNTHEGWQHTSNHAYTDKDNTYTHYGTNARHYASKIDTTNPWGYTRANNHGYDGCSIDFETAVLLHYACAVLRYQPLRG